MVWWGVGIDFEFGLPIPSPTSILNKRARSKFEKMCEPYFFHVLKNGTPERIAVKGTKIGTTRIQFLGHIFKDIPLDTNTYFTDLGNTKYVVASSTTRIFAHGMGTCDTTVVDYTIMAS